MNFSSTSALTEKLLPPSSESLESNSMIDSSKITVDSDSDDEEADNYTENNTENNTTPSPLESGLMTGSRMASPHSRSSTSLNNSPTSSSPSPTPPSGSSFSTIVREISNLTQSMVSSIAWLGGYKAGDAIFAWSDLKSNVTGVLKFLFNSSLTGVCDGAVCAIFYFINELIQCADEEINKEKIIEITKKSLQRFITYSVINTTFQPLVIFGDYLGSLLGNEETVGAIFSGLLIFVMNYGLTKAAHKLGLLTPEEASAFKNAMVESGVYVASPLSLPGSGHNDRDTEYVTVFSFAGYVLGSFLEKPVENSLNSLKKCCC
ncbi:MAG: hypothetical protein KIT27_02865 [Legionellales bacterium]|nr:hypothetical protein [Legionellales bacterium]